MSELTPEQEYRAEVANHIFNDGPAPVKPPQEPLQAEPEVEGEVVEEVEEVAQPVVDNGLNERLDKLTARFAVIDQLESRVKETVGRVGAIQRELDARKKEPTPAELAAATETDEAWEEFKIAWPLEAKAIERKLAAVEKNFPKVEAPEPVNLDEMRASLLQELQGDFAVKLVTARHKNWKQVVKSDEYKGFLAGLPDTERAKHWSDDPLDAIDLLDQFNDSRKPKKTAAQIKEERAAALNKAQKPSTSARAIQEKAEADMSPAELRAHIAKQVFST